MILRYGETWQQDNEAPCRHRQHQGGPGKMLTAYLLVC